MARAHHQNHCGCRADYKGGRHRRIAFRGHENHSRFGCTERRHGTRSSASVKQEKNWELTIRLIADDKQPNLMTYNEELRRMNRPTWRNVSWLYSECYLYRYPSRSSHANFPDFCTPSSKQPFTGNSMIPSSARRTTLSKRQKPVF